MYLTIPHHFLGKLINGLDHPVRLQMWETHSMRTLFSLLIQRGRRVKCYEKPDTKWNRAMHSQGCADTWVTVSWDVMTLHWDLPWGEEVQKANMATSDERAGCWLLSATLCERKAVCSLSSLGCTLTFTPQLKLCFNLHRCITFLITQAKHLPLWLKNVTKIIVSSVQHFLLSFFPLVLPPFYYFQSAFSCKCSHF